MSRAPVTALTAVLTTVLLLSGCTDDESPDFVPGPGPAKVDVDTPELRQLKKEAGVEDCAPGTGEPVDGGLPSVDLPCLGGGPAVDPATLRGPLVVNLWASWCSPCRQEMPVLQSFHEQYGDQVPMLGIDYEDPQATAALELVQDTGVTYPLLADPQAEFALRGLPYLALVDEDGRVVHRQYVEIESEQQLVDLVDEHLGVDL